MICDKQVSIIIPVYNSERYLGICLDSFLNQSYTNIELILIDDGSTDNSYKLMEEYKKRNPELIRIFSQENEGVACTRNRGILYAKGFYLMFADNDDYVEADYIEKMVNEIERTNSDMVVASCRKVDENHITIYEQVLTSDEWSKFRVVAPWARIMKREFILAHNIKFGDFSVGEDSFFSITAYNESANIFISEYIGYNWVHHNTSVSNTVQKKAIASPIPFLQALVDRNSQLKNISKEYFEYFIIKFIVWNLYYICDNLEQEMLNTICDQYFQWLEKVCPKYKENALLKPSSPKGEERLIRILVWGMGKSNFYLRKMLLKMVRFIKLHVYLAK